VELTYSTLKVNEKVEMLVIKAVPVALQAVVLPLTAAGVYKALAATTQRVNRRYMVQQCACWLTVSQQGTGASRAALTTSSVVTVVTVVTVAAVAAPAQEVAMAKFAVAKKMKAAVAAPAALTPEAAS
jgi:hypothetical protein